MSVQFKNLGVGQAFTFKFKPENLALGTPAWNHRGVWVKVSPRKYARRTDAERAADPKPHAVVSDVSFIVTPLA